ncbi:TonB-dependent hemoglobin/transferrin/lactoferrin family receptor [Rhodovulum steppense]|uniref:Hemoglobin/transferrin/lactoferrin receptor protein n=1 Tax=Rhodovulum steppense TaxID=540251 RepID=A0A4R1YIW1_9RHOB|nr:TonB-dependent hemoglobin/transferrin/lactoferrin family receptor [Rhodovulum steppense]TCM76558.1 hemoglobin/transferrin/lactoferrin receptor protein [Rhodovulum steppense]
MPTAVRRRARFLTTTAILVSCAAGGAAQTLSGAEERALPLGSITLLGDRQGSAVRDLPGSVSVVEGDEIEARGLNDMQEITRYLPGITVPRQTSGTDPFNSFGGFTIRGVGGNRVQMQVDGSRVAEAIQDGTRDYLDFNFTKQVDVVRGPASVLWGADALGGIVAVETIDPEDILAGRARGGTARLAFDGLNDETVASASFAQQMGPTLSLMLGLARTEAREVRLSNARADGGIYGCPRNVGFGATPCNRLDPTDISATRLLAKAVWTPTAEHRLEFSVDAMRRETAVQFDSVLGPVYNMMGTPTGEVNNNYDRDLDTDRTRIAVEHSWQARLGWVDEVKTTLAFTPHSYDRKGVRSSSSATGDAIITEDYLSFSEDFVELDIQATSRFTLGSASHELTWGFDGDRTQTDYSRRDVVRNLTQGTVTETHAGGFNFANADTRRADVYLQDKITLMDGVLELTPGLRFATYRIDPRPNADYQEVPGSEPSTRRDEAMLKSLGALYRFGEGWQVWGHYGEGFKMPTAQQLYTSVPGAFFDLIPAPDLKPEAVESLQFGLRRELAQGGFGVTLFDADYTDFIQSFYNPPGTTTYTYRNLSRVRVWGVEIEGEWDIRPDLRLTGAASWQKGTQRVSAGAAKTPHTLPPLTATLGLGWDMPDSAWSFDVVGTFAAGVHETAGANDFKPAGYGVIDVFAAWEVTETAVLNLGVKNLFDQRYFEASAARYATTASAAAARTNPIELQTGPGRVFTASLDIRF